MVNPNRIAIDLTSIAGFVSWRQAWLLTKSRSGVTTSSNYVLPDIIALSNKEAQTWEYTTALFFLYLRCQNLDFISQNSGLKTVYDYRIQNKFLIRKQLRYFFIDFGNFRL